MAKNRFKPGDRVKIRGTPKRGIILEVIEDIKEIKWERKLPHFLVVQIDGGSVVLAHPSQLKGTMK